jgi:hypothetical protein
MEIDEENEEKIKAAIKALIYTQQQIGTSKSRPFEHSFDEGVRRRKIA